MDFFALIGKGIEVYVCFLHWHRMGQHFVFLHWHRDVKILLFTLAQGWSTASFLMVERINFEVFVKVPSEPIKLLLRVSPSKEMGDRTSQRKKISDLGANRTHGLRIPSSVALPTKPRG